MGSNPSESTYGHADRSVIAREDTFYYPKRKQAMKIQETLETLYLEVGGEYYFGETAWGYVEDKTGIDLKGILEKIALENEQ